MIKIENYEVRGWDAAIRGMRNPLESWARSDSEFGMVGEADLKLMRKLCAAGPDHRKFMRFITVTADITAPLFWWKEFDTYKIGTVSNSCSTMHTIHKRDLTLDDFSVEHLQGDALRAVQAVVDTFNVLRDLYVNSPKYKGDKTVWRAMIELLLSSFNQKRTVMLPYEVLLNMNRPGRRRDHKLDEWREFCRWIDGLPYFKEITGVGE